MFIIIAFVVKIFSFLKEKVGTIELILLVDNSR